MRDIQIWVENPEEIKACERRMVAMARMTQRGETITSAEDFEALMNKPYSASTLLRMCDLPHVGIKYFGKINVAVIGASRRFLAQITRHRVGVDFMSGSLQYSDMSQKAKFVVPYDIIKKDIEEPVLGNEHYWEAQYLASCEQGARNYEAARKDNVDNDACGYMMPQGMRNVLYISATPAAWINMINIRTCRRNTAETRYVLLKIWEQLANYSVLFRTNIGPSCVRSNRCSEGTFTCGKSMWGRTPTSILKEDFKYIYKEGDTHDEQ